MLAVELSLLSQVFSFFYDLHDFATIRSFCPMLKFLIPSSLYFMSGCTNLPDLLDPSNKIQPDYYTSKVTDIFELMRP